MEATIEGGGIAAELARIVLQTSGWRVRTCGKSPAPRLINDIEVSPAFLACLGQILPAPGFRSIRSRPILSGQLRWKRGCDWSRLRKSSHVVDVDSLLRALRDYTPPAFTNADGHPAYCVPPRLSAVTCPDPVAGGTSQFQICFARYAVSPYFWESESTMEVVDDQWIYVLPAVSGDQAMVTVFSHRTASKPAQALERVVGHSSRARMLLGERLSDVGINQVAPMIDLSIGTGSQLKIGPALMRLQPICSNGAEISIKSALLAAAVVSAIGYGQESQPLIAHYRGRCVTFFRQQLAELTGLYHDAGIELPELGIWQEKATNLASGLSPSTLFRLNGFRVEPRS